MRKIKMKNWKTWTMVLLVFPVFLYVFVWLLQTKWSHRNNTFVPSYEQITLTENTDYKTFWMQTGLGKSVVERLLSENDMRTIREVQEAFFSRDQIQCISVFGWIVRSDRVEKKETAPLVDLQPGDILLSFSTHTLGWNHGHAGLVLNEKEVLECTSLGKKSRIVNTKHWRKYSNYIVLRVKGVGQEMQEQVASYARECLLDMPYRLSAGIFGTKAIDVTERHFGLQCAYLVWYAWQTVGYDLDGDGGRLVTPNDILESDKVEIIQLYGINPMELD